MRERQRVRILKRGLTRNSYLCDQGIVGRRRKRQGLPLACKKKNRPEEGLGVRYLLVARAGTDIEQYDRIGRKDKFYRVLWVRAFQSTWKAMLVKEKG
jgi:hypothetical protein